jgi:alkylation response protein AidB-like acyl-CoA dehydrogenase
MTTPEDLELIEEQRREIVALAREFAQKELAPFATERDLTKTCPLDVYKKLGELGFYGLTVPEEYDGLGLDPLTYLMVIEEIAAGDAGVAIALSVHNSMPVHMLRRYGTEEQKEKWLRRMGRGEVLAAFSISEADAGSDVVNLRAQAVKDGSDWVLNGEKAWVSNGNHAELCVTMVRTDTPNNRQGSRGVSTFLIPRETPGVEIGKPEDKMGLRASPTVNVVLNDVRLGPEFLVGEEGKGLSYALEALDQGRMGIAAQAVGIARSALEHSIAYGGERKQFGRPIREFQGLGFKLADMATRVTAARALVHEAAREKAAGKNVTVKAAMAKLFATETAMWVTTQAVQVFGGYGYTTDYPVERLFRDAKGTEIYEGTSEVQRIVISRGLSSE